MSNFYDFEWATDELSRARSEQAGKPLENNTRLFRRNDDSFAVKLHAVDVVTINRDGTYTLRAGGWHTITTMDRIRTYSPVRGTLFSERGDWYVRLTPSEDDPRPTRVERSIPKPFVTSDPGPEPVKNEEGCIAGQLVTTEHVNELVEVWFTDMKGDDEFVKVLRESGTGNHDYDRVQVRRSWNTHVYVGEGAQSYQDEGWREQAGAAYSSSYVINGDETVTYVQCSHCKDFDTVHENWRYRMHGDRYSRRFDEPGGYAVYVDMIERFGSEDEWQDAYIQDFRERRIYLQTEREWDQRNRVPFYDGITVDSDGYAQRKGGPSKAKLNKHERAVAKMKKRIDKYVNGFIAAMQAGEVPMPSNGDCWYCLLRTQDGKTMGDMGDNDHLIQHMEDAYYVPSLVVNALRERGYQDVSIYIHLGMDQDTGMMGVNRPSCDTIKRDLTKYMRKRLIPAAPTK
jgi:hypothetical protein